MVQPKTRAQRLASKQCAPTCTRSQPGTMPASSGVRLNAHAAAQSSPNSLQHDQRDLVTLAVQTPCRETSSIEGGIGPVMCEALM